MKTTESTEKSLGGGVVPPGTYVWQILEGVDVYENEDTGSRSFRVPMMVDSAVEGEGKPNMRGTFFQNFFTASGELNPMVESMMRKFLTACGAMEDLNKLTKGDDVNVAGDKFISWMRESLPGRFLELTHVIEERNGRENLKFTKWNKVGKEPVTIPEDSGSEDTEW